MPACGKQKQDDSFLFKASLVCTAARLSLGLWVGKMGKNQTWQPELDLQDLRCRGHQEWCLYHRGENGDSKHLWQDWWLPVCWNTCEATRSLWPTSAKFMNSWTPLTTRDQSHSSQEGSPWRMKSLTLHLLWLPMESACFLHPAALVCFLMSVCVIPEVTDMQVVPMSHRSRNRGLPKSSDPVKSDFITGLGLWSPGLPKCPKPSSFLSLMWSFYCQGHMHNWFPVFSVLSTNTTRQL